MARKMLRFVEKRGVHAARNGPSEDRKCWQRFELRIHGLKSWGRNWWRKVRETRSPFSDSRQERPNHLQDKGLCCTPPRSVGGGLRGTGSGGNYYAAQCGTTDVASEIWTRAGFTEQALHLSCMLPTRFANSLAP